MKRRDFITLLVGAAAAYPLAAHAQQTMRHVVVIMITPETDAPGQGRLKAFLQAFEKLGWIDRHNVRIDIRWAGDSPERMSEIVAETLALKPDVVLGAGTPAVAALRRAGTSIPIVFTTVNEPVVQGFVASIRGQAAISRASAWSSSRLSERWSRCSVGWYRRLPASDSCLILTPTLFTTPT